MEVVNVKQIKLTIFPYHDSRKVGHHTSIERKSKSFIGRWILKCSIFHGKSFQ